MLSDTVPFFRMFLFRFAYCLALAIAAYERAGYFWEQRDLGLFRGILVLMPFKGEQATALEYGLFTWALVVSLLFLAFGIAPRLFSVLSLFLYLNIFMPVSVWLEPFDDNIVVFNLIVLSFSSIGGAKDFIKRESWGRKEESWPLQLFILNLSLVYFSAFISKMHHSGWSWALGRHLQNYLYERYFQAGHELALFVAEHYWMCVAISVSILIFEASFWVTLFKTRFKAPIIFFGVCFHIGIFMIMGLNFLKVFMLGYLAFIPYDRIQVFFEKKGWA